MSDETSVPMIPSNSGLTFLDCAQKVLKNLAVISQCTMWTSRSRRVGKVGWSRQAKRLRTPRMPKSSQRSSANRRGGNRSALSSMVGVISV